MKSSRDAVRSIILEHQGKENAIKGELIAHMIGMDYKDVRETIRELILEDRIPIGSTCRGKNRGYYLIIRPEEAEEVCASLRRRALSILQRRSVIRKTTIQEEIRQLELEFRTD